MDIYRNWFKDLEKALRDNDNQKLISVILLCAHVREMVPPEALSSTFISSPRNVQMLLNLYQHLIKGGDSTTSKLMLSYQVTKWNTNNMSIPARPFFSNTVGSRLSIPSSVGSPSPVPTESSHSSAEYTTEVTSAPHYTAESATSHPNTPGQHEVPTPVVNDPSLPVLVTVAEDNCAKPFEVCGQLENSPCARSRVAPKQKQSVRDFVPGLSRVEREPDPFATETGNCNIEKGNLIQTIDLLRDGQQSLMDELTEYTTTLKGTLDLLRLTLAFLGKGNPSPLS